MRPELPQSASPGRGSGKRTHPTPLTTGGLLIAAAITLAYLAACSGGDATLAEVDPNAAPLVPAYEQVEAIVRTNCAPCHHSGDGGEDRDYSTCEGIHRGMYELRQTALENGSMPPGAWPRLSEREKLIIDRWIQQGGCSPCSVCR